jgi:transposase
MAKSKWPKVKENLHLVEKWARDGLTEAQISKNLGISKSTLNDYKNKYPDFSDSLKRGRQSCIVEIENALVKRALGFEYEEVKTYIKDEDGRVVKYTEKTKKYQAPDVGACAFLLKNKDKGNWSNNPMKLDLDRELVELQKKAQEMKCW